MSHRDTTEIGKKFFLAKMSNMSRLCEMSKKKRWWTYDLIQKWQHLDEENRNHT